MKASAPGQLRVGVVGCGPVGLLHARAYLDHPDVELAGVCDLDEARLQEAGERLRVPGYRSIEELAQDARPDLVSVVTRFDQLAAPVRACLQAGLHVLSEKPISFCAGEILDLVRLADRKALRFGVNFNQRFTAASAWFRQLREAGRFGEMQWTLAQYNQGGGAGYFALREHMIHQLDLWRYHIGEIAAVTGQARWSGAGEAEGNPDVVGATLQFVDGAIGVFTNGAPLVGGLNHYFELVGNRGRGWCENFVGRAVFRPHQGPPCFLDPPWIGPGGMYWDTFTTHLGMVVSELRAGRSMPVPARAAFEAQVLCDAVIQAVETGARIDVQALRQALLDDTDAP